LFRTATDDRELAALQKLANAWLSMTSAQLEHAVTPNGIAADQPRSAAGIALL
jgi:hypothetical protein